MYFAISNIMLDVQLSAFWASFCISTVVTAPVHAAGASLFTTFGRSSNTGGPVTHSPLRLVRHLCFVS
jgi:hypothetical protein